MYCLILGSITGVSVNAAFHRTMHSRRVQVTRKYSDDERL